MNLKEYRALAEAEVVAQASLDRADVKWRKAWWELTLALAEDGDKTTITKRYDVVAQVTGQNRGYLRHRAATGRRFRALGITEIRDVPPRLAMAIVENSDKAIAAQVLADKARQMERDGVSLRDAAQEITGKSWTAIPENLTQTERLAIAQQVMRDPKTAEKIIENTAPAVIAKAVAERHDVQRAVARNEDAVEAVYQEQIAHTRHHDVDVDSLNTLPKRMAKKTADALDIDQAVEYLRGAARELGNAIMCAEEWGVEDTDGEAEALQKIKRLLRTYESHGEITDRDAEWLASIGVEMH